MNSQLAARMLGFIVSCLWATCGLAQDPPAGPEPVEVAEPAAEAVPAEPIATPGEPTEPAVIAEPVEPTEPAEPAEPAEPTVAAAPPAPAGARRIAILPVEFTVYQKSVAGTEAVPEWSQAAQASLAQAAAEMLRRDERFAIVELPAPDDALGSLLREHVELFKIVGESATSLLQFGGKAWADKKVNFDYTIGDGLREFADHYGADYAFLLAGAQVTQSGGAVFMQLLLAAGGVGVAGGGTFMFAGIVDLRTGDVRWLNSKTGQQMFGVTGSDARNPETAAAMVTKLFEDFPSNKLARFAPF